MPLLPVPCAGITPPASRRPSSIPFSQPTFSYTRSNLNYRIPTCVATPPPSVFTMLAIYDDIVFDDMVRVDTAGMVMGKVRE